MDTFQHLTEFNRFGYSYLCEKYLKNYIDTSGELLLNQYFVKQTT